MNVIRVADFAKFPGPRYKRLGKFSGEEFRDEKLIPAIKDSSGELLVDLDGVFGYGSSFLEEAFGGLVRKGIDGRVIRNIVDNIKSVDQPELKKEIAEYVEAELSARG